MRVPIPPDININNGARIFANARPSVQSTCIRDEINDQPHRICTVAATAPSLLIPRNFNALSPFNTWQSYIYIYTQIHALTGKWTLIFFLSRVSSIHSIRTFFLIHAFENLVLILPLLFGEREREKRTLVRMGTRRFPGNVANYRSLPRINIFFPPLSFPSFLFSPFFKQTFACHRAISRSVINDNE